MGLDDRSYNVVSAVGRNKDTLLTNEHNPLRILLIRERGEKSR